MNFKPRTNWIVTTSYLVNKAASNLILGNDNTPTIKEVQKVVAVGDNTDIKVGDYVVIDLTRFIKQVKTKSTIRAGIGGQEMIKEELVIPFFAIPGDSTPYLKLSDREIEGTIPDFESLPEDIKSYTTMEDFQKQQEDLAKKSDKVAKEEKARIDLAKSKNTPKGNTYPLIRTDSQKL